MTAGIFPTLPQTPADVVKAVRAAQKMNIRDFGAALGISHAMIANYENSKSEPSNEQLRTWLYSSTEWISDMATEMFVARYRSLLKSGLPVSA